LNSIPLSPSFRRVELFVSAEQVPAGHAFSLDWKVVGPDGVASSVQPEQGMRQMIFARPGLFTFTLIVIFQDGVRRSKQIRVRVTG
jgi:hypothetical protein